ncbi:uncharacterized protein [Primulina huaijiensis]|uniref:uncharacterized protein isoform X2 n=1 Tax=Primulina huaijiensis TaxID=1492673 RepID=UPI003CC735FC
MTAEDEVCNGAVSEAAGIEEKSEFKARSFQDLSESGLNGIGNHDQADDPEDSYVLVTDVGDSSSDGNCMASVDGSPWHESSAPVEIELDARNENPEGADVGKHGDVEGGDESFTLVNGSPDVPFISIGRDRDTVGEENKYLEEWSNQNGKTDVVNGEIDPTSTEGGFVNAASTNENPSVANGVLLGIEVSVGDEDEIRDKLAFSKPECRAESEIKKTAQSNGMIERSEEAEVAKFEDQNGEIGVVAEAEPDTAVRKPESGAESEIKKADESNGKIERSEEAEVAKFEDQSGKIGVVAEAEMDTAFRKPECGAEYEINKSNESNGNIERSEKDEAAKFEDQNGKIGVVPEAESDMVEDQLISEASRGVEENQEFKVPNLILVVESEEVETKSSLSPFDKQETVEDEAESALGKEAMEDQKSDIDTEKDDQYGLDKDKAVERNVDCNVRMVSDEVLEVKDEGVSGVYHVEGSMTYPEDAINSRDGNGATPQISVSERVAGASGPTQKIPASGVQFHRPLNEVQISDAETAGVISSVPVDGSESESFEKEHVHLDSFETSTIDDVCSGSDRIVVSNEKEPISLGSELSTDSEDYRNPPVSAVKLEPEAHNSSAVNHGQIQKIPASRVHVHRPANEVQFSDAETAGVISSLPVDDSESEVVSNDKEPISQGSELSAEFEDDRNPPVSAVKLETEAHNSSAVNHVDVSSERDATSGSDILDTFVSDKVTKEDVSGVAVTKPFNFFVRTPRYSDEKLQEQIRIAVLEVNEKTKLRDCIRAQIQEKRAKNQNNGIDYEYAKGEDRSLKKLLKEKRIEIDSLQSVINKAKNATSMEDLNSQIKTIEHMIQHETLPLKEEKQFIHEIKQLREQLSSSKCSQNEIQQALEQREQAEERLKTLRKELGNLKDTSSKTQTVCDEAESKYNVEHKKVKELQAQFRAADDIRQEAYAKYLCLSKELSQKRKNFFKFKNDSARATYHAFNDDRKTLYRHCVNVVENFMELWNGNNEFRSEYVRLNTRSTLRRFGTLDGRSLGPDEKPPILPSHVRERNDKVVSVTANADSISRSPTMELKPETNFENVSSDIHSSKKETESKEKTVITREPAKSKQVNSLATVSSMDEEKVEVQEEPIKTKEELELIRKAEEEEAEAELKEQRRLEEIVKAKEARERKQRRDEKTQKREELKARKETEQKEKKREKKSRKKERKKAATTSTSASMDLQDDASSITCVESIKEEASTQVNDISTKKPKMSRVMASKQNKTRSVLPPPSLRNRNRRKWQQWMWIILVSLLVLILFWLGNMGVFSSVNSKLQGTGF